jgi:S1-C subfamily serine protease
LGVQLLSDDVGRRYGIDGVVVGYVYPRSAAAVAGIRGLQRGVFGRYAMGDVIVGVSGTKVATGDELSYELEKHSVGDTVALDLMRDGKKTSVKVKLQQVD